MPRRGNVPKREILPDPMYNSVLVTKLINGVMLDGKKGVAQKVVYDAFDIIREKTGKEPLDAFNEAMNNIINNLPKNSREPVTRRSRNKEPKNMLEQIKQKQKDNV